MLQEDRNTLELRSSQTHICSFRVFAATSKLIRRVEEGSSTCPWMCSFPEYEHPKRKKDEKLAEMAFTNFFSSFSDVIAFIIN